MRKDKIQVCFSLAVHEKPEVVINQLENIHNHCGHLKYMVVLHLSKHFYISNEQLNEICANKNVLINPVRFITGWGDGSLLRVHISNIEFFNTILESEYFSFLSSNQLFIRKFHYPSSAFSSAFPITSRTDWQQTDKARSDRILKKITHGMDFSNYYGNQIEGYTISNKMTIMFIKAISNKYPLYRFKYQLINSIFYRINKNRILKMYLNMVFKGISDTRYPTEEVYIGTVLKYLLGDEFEIMNAKSNPPCCYINWNNYHSIHLEEISDKYFSVKPVKRDINDPFRIKISKLKN